ncbi:MIP18 family protein [[Candida] railenensis]|uniref:MIP18 family protein n=1 Tax=[Candida] railenensis TaxID=45579 RepID=A0A9P0QL56_9ASCO|nr:MIP18 family protein [[Candida] railenensis]
MDDPINANPTIIDVSELPTRLENENKKGTGEQLVAQIVSLSLLPKSAKVSASSTSSQVPDLVSDSGSEDDEEDEEEDPVDAQEIFDLISSISDPEHPLTLAQLAVVNLADIYVPDHQADKSKICEIVIKITPTITHCSLATLIGLGIRVRLERCLPPRFRIKILIKEGTHQSENQVNKQLNDKERVAAACENDQLLTVISQMLSSCK